MVMHVFVVFAQATVTEERDLKEIQLNSNEEKNEIWVFNIVKREWKIAIEN